MATLQMQHRSLLTCSVRAFLLLPMGQRAIKNWYLKWSFYIIRSIIKVKDTIPIISKQTMVIMNKYICKECKTNSQGSDTMMPWCMCVCVCAYVCLCVRVDVCTCAQTCACVFTSIKIQDELKERNLFKPWG